MGGKERKHHASNRILWPYQLRQPTSRSTANTSYSCSLSTENAYYLRDAHIQPQSNDELWYDRAQFQGNHSSHYKEENTTTKQPTRRYNTKKKRKERVTARLSRQKRMKRKQEEENRKDRRKKRREPHANLIFDGGCHLKQELFMFLDWKFANIMISPDNSLKTWQK